MFKDLRHGARTLLRDKSWTAVVVLSLALGIGANTALFGAVNGLFLKRLSVPDPDTLVRLKWAGRNDMVTDSSDYGFSAKDAAGLNVRSTFSYPMFRQFVADNRTMEDLFACAPYGRANVVVDGQADIAGAFVSSGNYYRVLGLTANPGRTIVPEDDQPTASPAAVISARYWRTRFASDPRAVGKVVQLNNVPVTIVGVISPELIDAQQAVRDGPDIAVPLALVSQLANAPTVPGEPNVPLLERPTYWWLQIMGRLKPGVTAAQVQANLESVFQHTARAGLDAYLGSLPAEARSTSSNRNRTDVPHLRVDSGSRGIYDVNTSDSTAVTILSVVVLLILLIVCANVANLLLSRAATRQKEISIRLSLGATRGRLVRQLLTESLLLAAMGGALGVLIGHWGQQLLPGNAGHATPLDWRVLSFVVAVTGLTGIVFGIAPALRGTGMNVSSALKETSRSVAGSRSILSKSLLVLQVAVSLVLLIAAGLFLRTLQNLRNVDVGFNTRNLVLFRVTPFLNRYDEARTVALYQQLSDRLRSVAGVRSVALSNVQLLSSSVNSTSIFVQGRTYAQDRHDSTTHDSINRLVISPGFFETMEMPMRVGRGFTDRDDQKAPKVAIINETAARKYFPNENPIGQRIGSSVETAGQTEIVGVLRDAKYDSVRDPVPPTMYVPYLQARVPSATFEVRTAGDPVATIGAIREAVRKIDPNLPLMNVSTQVEQVEKRLGQERVFAQAYALFGALALLLASVGLFGLMSYSVARRTNEIGVRMALGAQRQDVVRLVMGESMTLVIVGVAIGLTAAVAASRLVASLLFGLAATDLPTMLAAIMVLFVVSAIAGYLPARRAARVDPLVALHYE
jgi:predicted permease